ncbi:transposase family protein [Streptomyces gardneri]|uniref:transposase family protein n=1 Tax=Streptomyces gardneri TaxID=66892 RepID=UPI00369DC98B
MACVVGNRARAAIIRSRWITGLTPEVIAELVAKVSPLWHERHQAGLASRPRCRAVGTGAKHFIDRLLATLVHLSHGPTHHVLACWFGVARSTITRAIGEVRPLLATRGCTIAPGIRLRTLAEVVDHLGASGQTGIIDGTEIRVRRPAAGRKNREKFISGKNKQNAVKSMVVTDADGRLLFCSPAQPASCADITHARQLGLVKVLADGPVVEMLADAGYQELGAQTGSRVVTPPHRKFKKDAPHWYEEMHERQRKAHSSRRIRVEADVQFDGFAYKSDFTEGLEVHDTDWNDHMMWVYTIRRAVLVFNATITPQREVTDLTFEGGDQAAGRDS